MILLLRALSDRQPEAIGSTIPAPLDKDPFAVSTPRLEGGHVLIVDDEADTRELLSLALASAVAQVKACASVSEAMAALRRLSPDLINV